MFKPCSGSGTGPGRLSFSRFARWTERQVGTPISFATAVAIVVLWAGSGPFFGWSDTWQLVINTGTTIVTFLMVFLIQSTQSRDNQALHLKLDERCPKRTSSRSKPPFGGSSPVRKRP